MLKRYLRLLTPWMLGLCIAASIYGNTIHSWYSNIDDHQIVAWLGPTHALPFNRLWHELVAMRFGLFDEQARFRPLFFLYWLIETTLLGDRPYLYHVLRIIYFGLFLGSLIWVATPTLGIIVATLVTAVLALQVFWVQIWAYSLGVLEQLATLGLAITIVGYGQVISDWVHNTPRGGRGIIAVSIGTAIAIGCKENFVFLMVPLSTTLLAFYYRKMLNYGDLVKSVPFLAFSVICLAGVLYTSMTIHVDAYGVDSSLRHRLSVVAAAPIVWSSAITAFIAALVLSYVALRKSPLDNKFLVPTTQVFIVGVTILCGYLIWEIFIYNGVLPGAGNRYAFPFRVLPIAIICVFASFLVVVFPFQARWWRVIALLGLGLFVIWKPRSFDAQAVFAQTTEEVLATRGFHSALDELAVNARSHPTWPIVIDVKNAWDYEPVVTFKDWSAYKGIMNPVFLRFAIPNERLSPFESGLIQEMKAMASRGSIGHVESFPDLSRLVSEGQCFDADAVIDPEKRRLPRKQSSAEDSNCSPPATN
jgi:hypothetical protein